MAGPMDRRTVISVISISVNKRRVTHLDTSAFQNVDFLTSYLSATPKPKPTDSWTDGRTHEMTTIPIGIDVGRVSHLNTSACKISCHSFHVLCQQVSINLKMQWTNGRTDRQAEGWSDRRVACGIFLCHLNLVQDKMWSEMKIERMYKKVSHLDTVILTLTYDLEKLIRSGHCHY